MQKTPAEPAATYRINSSTRRSTILWRRGVMVPSGPRRGRSIVLPSRKRSSTRGSTYELRQTAGPLARQLDRGEHGPMPGAEVLRRELLARTKDEQVVGAAVAATHRFDRRPDLGVADQLHTPPAALGREVDDDLPVFDRHVLAQDRRDAVALVGLGVLLAADPEQGRGRGGGRRMPGRTRTSTRTALRRPQPKSGNRPGTDESRWDPGWQPLPSVTPGGCRKTATAYAEAEGGPPPRSGPSAFAPEPLSETRPEALRDSPPAPR
jgi:hypothetical protein